MIPKHRKSSLGRSRDFGTTGSGKGSSDRTTNREVFDMNLLEVKFDGVTGLKKVGLKFVKVYGPSRKPALPPDEEITDPRHPLYVPNYVSIPVTNDLVRE